ncbi:MAG TPA: phospholipid carrier-dependent glycosyltransferase [Candidatus Acidoferrales bacterium]|nr:phospholipid carrier-dependent glycosyltransferase [Candidatus Acidoferrales bacterium]
MRRAWPHRKIAAAVAALAVLLVCLFTGLSAIGLVGPDEPRYAWIARTMAHNGNWITPYLYGAPWFEKPIFYYWAAAIGFKLVPSLEWAARLPSAFAALVAALATAWLGWKRYGERTAWAILLIFPTCAGIIAFSRAAAPDMLFTASLAVALVCATSVLEKQGLFCAFDGNAQKNSLSSGSLRDKLPLIFLGVWLGFATLAKGPAALILSGGSVLLWAIVTRHLKKAIRLLHPLAILSFCVVALPWYALCAYYNPSFFHTFILLHNFQRYLTPVFQHRQPFWFFGPIVLIGLLPWTALLIGAAIDGRRIFREGSWRNSFGFFVACWAILPFVFFSFSRSKLPEYILPIFPPLVLLLGHSFIRAIDKAPRTAQWLGVATGTMWAILGIAGAVGFQKLPPYEPPYASGTHKLAVVAILIGVFTGVAVECLSLARRAWYALVFTSLVCAASVLVAGVRILPELDPLLSTRPLAHEIQHLLPSRSASPDSQLYSVGNVNRNCGYGLRFYLGLDKIAQFTPGGAHEDFVLLSGDGDMTLNYLGIIHRKIIAKFLPYCWVESLPSQQTSGAK